MLEFQVGNVKTDPKPWFVQWRKHNGTWAELTNTRSSSKFGALAFVQVAESTQRAIINNP
jgi:hypothetical protein